MPKLSINQISFKEYKSLKNYNLHISGLNILVGPNNSGKSTIIGALRLLEQTLRKAKSSKATTIQRDGEKLPAWFIALESLPVSYENIHTNYQDTDSEITFIFSNKVRAGLYFPKGGGCYFWAEGDYGAITESAALKRLLPFKLVIVPILGPLAHNERRVSPDTVSKNLISTRASRNFRNYWMQNPENFAEFVDLVEKTWPGMSVLPPEVNVDTVSMFCKEGRIDRELFWSGFGFQIWLQLLTHVSRSKDADLFVVDEPELYLHADVQRQLLGILRDMNGDVVLASHSSEIIGEADHSEIVLIDKTKRKSERLRDTAGIQKVLELMGSVQNITLTKLAKNKRILFVEGPSDSRLIRRFAKRFGFPDLEQGKDYTVLLSGGFSSWKEIRALAAGFENALGVPLKVAAIFDRDFWCHDEIEEIAAELKQHLQFSCIHSCKEIENYLLDPQVLQEALQAAIEDQQMRSRIKQAAAMNVGDQLLKITDGMKDELLDIFQAKYLEYNKKQRKDNKLLLGEAKAEFNQSWNDFVSRMKMVPGKRTLARLRESITAKHKVSLSDHRIVTKFPKNNCPDDLKDLLQGLDGFRHV
ncbi:MAG: AAA family ATPase [Hyphomicrobiales bacterium]|nr:AAA family ATPase [Hyphomicrobiales bacterium]